MVVFQLWSSASGSLLSLRSDRVFTFLRRYSLAISGLEAASHHQSRGISTMTLWNRALSSEAEETGRAIRGIVEGLNLRDGFKFGLEMLFLFHWKTKTEAIIVRVELVQRFPFKPSYFSKEIAEEDHIWLKTIPILMMISALWLQAGDYVSFSIKLQVL